MEQLLFLIGAGFLGGAMNAIAGGGSFVTFPALLAAGVPSIAANASSTVALFPGSLTSAWAYRKDVQRFGEVSLKLLLVTSMAGGTLGSLLLLATPERVFDKAVPWLVLLASVVFAFGRTAGRHLRSRVRIGPVPLVIGQFALAVYGGYFGGAVGIMMMALWSLLYSAEASVLNPARIVMVGATNLVAVVCFIVAGQIWWQQTIVMLLAAAAGGFAGAHLARALPPQHVRTAIIIGSFAITAALFLR